MQIKKIALATLSAMGFLTLTSCNAADSAPPAAPAGKIMAVVNGTVIPQAELNVLEQDRAAQGQPVDDKTSAALRNSLIDGEILAQQAEKAGLNKSSDFENHLALAKTQMLAQAYIAYYVKTHPVTEAAMQAEYNRVKAMMGDKEYEVEHILVATPDEANKVIDKLNKKAKFEDLAKKESKDSSAANGGNLGWVAPANLVPEFSSAMVKLKKGEYTKQPVHTKFGWHVIKLVDIRPLKFPAYDQVKGQLRASLEQKEVQQLIAQLRASAKVE